MKGPMFIRAWRLIESSVTSKLESPDLKEKLCAARGSAAATNTTATIAKRRIMKAS